MKVRKQLEADLRKVTCDIDHLDATIPLFDPETAPAAIKRYATEVPPVSTGHRHQPKDLGVVLGMCLCPIRSRRLS